MGLRGWSWWVRALAVLVVIVSAHGGASTGIAQMTGPLDPRSLALSVDELPPGFADAGRTSFEERPDGTAAYETTYVRPVDASAIGPTEIRFSIGRTLSGTDSARLLLTMRQGLQAGGWSEQPVPALGDEAIGLNLRGGTTVAYLYLFRFGRHVVGSGVAGLATSTSFDDALGLAIQLSGRLDVALAAQPLPDPAPAPVAATTVEPPASPAAQTAASLPTGPPPSETVATEPTAAGSQPQRVSAPTIVADARLTDAPDLGDGLKLGGFSGLFATDKGGTTFLTLTDRGPNGEIEVQGRKQMAFALPTFTPRLVKLRIDSDQLRVVETIPLRLADGYTDSVTRSRDVTGLPSYDSGETPYNANGAGRLPFDPNGVDTEGVAIDPRDGSYWLVEEYGPSILHVGVDGTVLARIVPRGSGVAAPAQNVRDLLPGALLKREPNRGFEGVAVSPDGTRVFAIMQGPLSNPNKKAGSASRMVRLIVLDTNNGGEPKLVGTYVYQLEAAGDVGAREQNDIRVGDIAALSATRVLVGERDNQEDGAHKKIYLVDLSAASDVTNRDDVGGKTLEQASESELRRAGIEVARKSLVVDVARLGYRPEKLEGLAIVDPYTIAVINDDDFGVAEIGSRGVVQSGRASRLILIRLPVALQ
jgi:hypothetical protein